jgi:type IV pilus assembly protein PilB
MSEAPDEVDESVSPATRIVGQMLRSLLDPGLEAIHVESSESAFRIWHRRGGVLSEMEDYPPPLARAVIGRLKGMAGLDIAERKEAQHGRLTYRLDENQMALSVFTVFVAGGEKVILTVESRA